MEKDKKYHWLRLKNDFFKRHDIKIIEAQPNGEKYVLFYLKMLVESLSHNGELRFNEKIPYDNKMLAIVTNTDPDVVKSAMDILINLELIKVSDNKTIFMAEVNNMIGSETYWAEKKRDKRNKQALELDNVQQESNECPPCPSKSLEFRVKSLEIKKENTFKDICQRVIENLNWQTGRKFKTVESNTKHVIARLNEGYSEEECIRVVHNKVIDWFDNPDMKDFLRPSTLFGTKFDGYLQGNDQSGLRTNAEIEKIIKESENPHE